MYLLQLESCTLRQSSALASSSSTVTRCSSRELSKLPRRALGSIYAVGLEHSKPRLTAKPGVCVYVCVGVYDCVCLSVYVYVCV